VGVVVLVCSALCKTPTIHNRDLAARNVLLRQETQECVVSDFGLARKVETEEGQKTALTVGPLVRVVLFVEL
jgi:hypothetical protein